MRVLIALPWTSFLRQSIHPIVPWHGPKAGSEGNLSRLAACSSRRRLATIPPPRGPYQDGEEQQDEAREPVNLPRPGGRGAVPDADGHAGRGRLRRRPRRRRRLVEVRKAAPRAARQGSQQRHLPAPRLLAQRPGGRQAQRGRPHRAEEHTSELKALMRMSYAVFCPTKKH